MDYKSPWSTCMDWLIVCTAGAFVGVGLWDSSALDLCQYGAVCSAMMPIKQRKKQIRNIGGRFSNGKRHGITYSPPVYAEHSRPMGTHREGHSSGAHPIGSTDEAMRSARAAAMGVRCRTR